MKNKTQERTRMDISVISYRLLRQLLDENPLLDDILTGSENENEALERIRAWVMEEIKNNPSAYRFYTGEFHDREVFEKLDWRDLAAIRILDYIDNAGREFTDLNLGGEKVYSNPLYLVWRAVKNGSGGTKPGFFQDMIMLFRQFSGLLERELPSREKVGEWMDRWPSGLDPRVIQLREKNRDRILNLIIRKIDSGEIQASRFFFDPGMSDEEKRLRALQWWKDRAFHIHFAVRSPDLLNEFLGDSLDLDTMKTLYEAKKKGIPFFVNPYYLSLLNVHTPEFAVGADLAIRYYVLYSEQLVNEYGSILAWEKEDQVEPGKPNAAGWILPNDHNIHRRYPEVAILIPDTMGRACGGLCASCQRMYDFQRGNLNFNLDKLKPKLTWDEKLDNLLKYFEQDSQLRDILITGGDALMSADRTLTRILDGVYTMALNKRNANESREPGKKYAEIVRVRLGTRLPVYLPQRVTPELVGILSDFKRKASKIGIKQFFIQTHFESPMEVTPEARDAVQKLHDAGWVVTNQLVFTAAASRRGHTAKLRKVLNEIGVINYYTFSVKGYMENYFPFATNERAVQEQFEEKAVGIIGREYYGEISKLSSNAERIEENLAALLEKADIPFLASDRNVLNLPGVGKSLTFRTIGLTRYGRRILEFELDHTRNHSPAMEKMDKVIIIESKSISEYLQQLDDFGEDVSEYETIWGYSIGETERRISLYEYPDYPFELTEKHTNLEVPVP
ncbi:MAG: KamA family protein [Acidobacteriota bacterium]